MRNPNKLLSTLQVVPEKNILNGYTWTTSLLHACSSDLKARKDSYNVSYNVKNMRKTGEKTTISRICIIIVASLIRLKPCFLLLLKLVLLNQRVHFEKKYAT